MADFEAVLKKTLGGMTNPTPEMRAKVYERARATITRQIEALEKRPSDAAVKRQYDKLDAAIAEIEKQFAKTPEPAQAGPESDLDHLFETDLPRREAPKPAGVLCGDYVTGRERLSKPDGRVAGVPERRRREQEDASIHRATTFHAAILTATLR